MLTSGSTLRFRSRSELTGSLAAAGLTVEEIRDAPDRPGREFVHIARREPTHTTGQHTTGVRDRKTLEQPRRNGPA